MTVGRSLASAWRTACSNARVGLDPDPARAAGPRDRGEVDRPEVRGDRRRRLPRPAGPGASGSCRSARCRTRSRSPSPSRGRPSRARPSSSRSRRRRRTRRSTRSRWTRPAAIAAGRRVAHRPGRRPEERARPPEPEVARDPQPEVARVGRDDRVVGDQPPDGRDGMGRDGRRARSRPSRPAVVAASQAARSATLRGLASVGRRRVEDGLLEPGDGRPEERPGVGADRARRRRQARPVVERLDVDVHPGAGPRPGSRTRTSVISDRRQPMTSIASACSSRSRTTRRAAVAGHPEVERMIVRDHVGPRASRR